MRTFEEFALELTSARQKNDRSAVISLCREAAHAYTLPGSQEWYAAHTIWGRSWIAPCNHGT